MIANMNKRPTQTSLANNLAASNQLVQCSRHPPHLTCEPLVSIFLSLSVGRRKGDAVLAIIIWPISMIDLSFSLAH